jgi:parallel beta-helix repeat protein
MDNTISNNDWGVTIFHSSDNNFIGNTASNNRYCIRLDESSNNTIYHNNFINNKQNAYNEEGNNIWEDEKYGNYWSDYEEKYPDAKPKLFKPWMWDTPYEISGGDNQDNCPLVKQWPNSVSIDISRNKVTNNVLLQRILGRFPLFQRLWNVWRFNS